LAGLLQERHTERFPLWIAVTQARAVPLLLEALAVYVLAPLLLDQLLAHGYRSALFPTIWVMALIAALLWRHIDPTWWAKLWALPPANRALFWWSLRVNVSFGLLALLCRHLVPDDFLRLPREAPALWMLIAIAYPLLSLGGGSAPLCLGAPHLSKPDRDRRDLRRWSSVPLHLPQHRIVAAFERGTRDLRRGCIHVRAWTISLPRRRSRGTLVS
jgi:hypothetical protein